jgi:hypothetical protein
MLGLSLSKFLIAVLEGCITSPRAFLASFDAVGVGFIVMVLLPVENHARGSRRRYQHAHRRRSQNANQIASKHLRSPDS